MVAELVYRASFFLYEISFFLLALGLGLYGESLRRIGRELSLPPLWLFPAVSAGLMVVCALLHFYVYHFLSPRYLARGEHELLLLMYLLKTLSMASIFVAGLSLTVGNLLYLRQTTR